MRIPVVVFTGVEADAGVVPRRTGMAAAPGGALSGSRRPLLARQLEALLGHLPNAGCAAIPLQALLERRLPVQARHAMCLCFDGGLASHHDLVLPILERLGLTATFFLRPEQLGRPGQLTGGQLDRMARAGMRFGIELPAAEELALLSPGQRVRMLREERALLELRLGQPIRIAATRGPLPEPELLRQLRGYGYAAVAFGQPGNHMVIEGLLCIARREITPGLSPLEWLELVRCDRLSPQALGFWLREEAARGGVR
ncbi:MAG: hypothetical protein KatS3mg102_1158 [Planctomycetota bacterium]|nr:MAG: hypothetical protein KatS3mg102_1158 [Planctomycetota bacterium]